MKEIILASASERRSRILSDCRIAHKVVPSGIEEEISSGTLGSEDLIKKSNRVGEIIKLLDEKSDRWLELSEYI